MLQHIASYGSGLHPAALTALISAVVSLLTAAGLYFIRFFLAKRSLRYRLKTEYEYAQRKQMRDLIVRYRGRMLEAAEVLNHRLFNLYRNEAQGWLSAGGHYDGELGYYFTTTAYRFLGLCALARQFQAEAIFVDARIAESSDLDFVKFAKAFEWVATDVSLFEGLDYDAFDATDHFFKDGLRNICDHCLSNGSLLGLDEFSKCIRGGGEGARFLPALQFFDGLSSGEARLRWDRVVAFHLLVMAFINEFGYDMQRSTRSQFLEVARRIRHPHVRRNLRGWLPRLGLGGQRASKLVLSALKRG